MRIAYIVPGSGGSFYCGNCIRDVNLLAGLRKLGQEVIVVPMYLPVMPEDCSVQVDTPVFCGAVNIYLKHKFRLLRRAPGWVDRMLDSPLLLRLAAKRAGSTRASGLGEMTLSMLRGEEGGLAGEFEKLVRMLRDVVKPDVVHLSNALLLGLVKRIKQELPAAVVCSLQDEDMWIDAMEKDDALEAWRLLKERSADVDIMLPVSRYYADFIKKHMPIRSNPLTVIPIGIDVEGYERAPLSSNPPVIGFLSRMSEASGLGLLVEAFLKLKKQGPLKGVKLLVTGGKTGDDRVFLRKLRKDIRTHGCDQDVQFVRAFDRPARQNFFRSLSLFSVPVLKGRAFGVYLLEAFASGVPVVQPKIGAFPEIIKTTGGGVLYEPNDARTLASTLSSLLLDPGRIRELGSQGGVSVRKHYSIETAAKKMVRVYEKSIDIRS